MPSLRLRHLSLLFLAANLVCAAGPTVSSAAPPAASETETQAVAAATAGWYAALNAMFEGNGEPMKTAWSHADDVSDMGPGGNYLVGWEKIGAEWEAQTAAKLGCEVRRAAPAHRDL